MCDGVSGSERRGKAGVMRWYRFWEGVGRAIQDEGGLGEAVQDVDGEKHERNTGTMVG